MEAFETTLTGSAGPIDGVVTHLSKNAYQFSSIDGALELTITKNPEGRWVRLAGTEPYFSGWVDELVDRINAQPVLVLPVTEKAAPTITKALVKKVAVKPTLKKDPAKSANKAAAKKETTKPSLKKEAAKPAAKKITEKTGTVKKAKVSSGSTKTK